MPEGARRGSQRSPSNSAAKRPSSVSSLSGIVGRMMSSGERGASSSSCTSVNTVCSDGERPASLSLSSSASSVSLQDTSHSSSSSSSSSLPYGAVPTYSASSSSLSSSTPKRNGSDISLDLTPLVTPHGGGRGGVAKAANRLAANQAAMEAATPRQLSRLERVVLEIVETEQTYVRDLKSIVEDYLGCIIDCGGALPLNPEQVSTLFCNIEDIYEFNSDLLEDLERSRDAASIAECFVERSEAFDIYTLYCMNYPNSVAILRDCMKNQSLVLFFQERRLTLSHSLPLETYLLKPVQRILKYHLLLQELSKHFDKSDPGYEVVEDAIITMTAVAWYINDMKRKQEHAVRLQEIESLLVNWTGPDLSGFGELVLEGSFKVQRVKKERAFFLFDKMLLIAKKRVEMFVYSTHIFCCNLLLVENLKDPLCFRVSDQTIPKQQHVVQTKNQEEKRLWVHYLKRLIVENHPASLPQKARQVLGDTFCQTPQFNQDNLKKSTTPSRLDDLHGYHRGRRQSEPPELLLYTPEKSRKSLPLLLEGNLPYRRTRRQSAPAKDIEAAFHPDALKAAGSDGELCPADALGSAGSSSTLASSVIEVEAETPEPSAAPPPRPGREEEEREEEELPPLSPAPTLSITEEILEFINQSRARGGLFTADPEVQSSDRPQESDLPSDEGNFTCPLPPAASSTPEQTPIMQQEQEGAETRLLQSAGSAEENRLEDETTAAAEEPPAETSRVETGAEEDEEKRREEAEEEKQTREREEDESAPHLHPSISAEEEDEKKSCPSAENDTEASSSSSSSSQTPDVLQPVQRRRPPARGAHLTRRDKKIIEKIRSYYEAAAKAEEEEEEEPEEEVGSRRRSSFSQIPSGLVKESVSRFDTSGHQGEPEGGQSKTEPAEGVRRDKESGFSSPLSEDPGNDGEAGELVCSLLDVPAEDMREQDQETQDQEDLDLQVDPNGSVGAEAELEVCTGPPSGPGGLEEKQELETRVVDTGQQSPLREEGPPEFSPSTNKDETSPGNPAVRNGPESEPNGRHEEPPTEQKPEARPQSSWNRSKHRDLAKTSKNLEGLPSQIKVGRWSHHSRIVTANRALFESMGSDVARIGLFETSPVVDPMLVENSERILSKVQTLAQMYSAKASTMKVPLHQKRAAATVRTPAWVSAKPSSPPAGTQTRSPDQNQVQSSTEHRQVQNNPSDTLREIKTGTQTLEAKVQSQTRQIRIQTTGQEDESIQEKTVKRAESQTADLQQRATVPCQPQLFGPAAVKEPLTPTNGFTLSRPRDFISALTRDTVDDPQTPTTAKESPPPHQDQDLGSGSETADASSGSAASRRQLRTQAEGPSSTWSVGSEEDLDQDLDVFPDPEGTRVRDRLELTGGCPVSSVVVVAQSTQQSEEQVKCSLDASQQALREPEESSTKGVDTVHVGPGPPGELVFIVASIPSRAQTEDHKSEPGIAGDQTTTLGTSGELMSNGNYSVQQGSTVIFTDEPAAYRHSGGLAATLDLSTGTTTLPRENPWSWVPSSEPSLGQPSRPLVASTDVLPTFTNQRPTDLVSTAGKQAPSNTRSVSSTSSNEQRNVREPDQQGSWSSASPPVSSFPSGHAYSEAPNLVDRTDLMMTIPGRDSASSAFEHGQQRCPSPVRTLHFLSSTQTPSGTSSLRTVPSPTPTPAEDISTNTVSRVLPCLSPTLSPGSVSSVRSPPSSSPTPSSACVSSSSCRSSSLRTGPPSSTSLSSVRSPPCSSPIASSSAFTRSLAASCISQSISHSLARKTTASQQGPPLNTPVNQSQSTHLRRRSPSPKLLAQNQQGSSALAPAQQGGIKDGYQRQKCPASSPWSSCPSPRLSEHSSSPSMSLGRHSTPPSPRPSFLHSRSDTSHNLNNNNNNNNSGINKSSTCGVSHTLGNGACLVNPHKAVLSSSSIAVTHDPLWSGSHNRVARPFSASEPSSRVQSPSPSPTPASFSRLCSPPPQHNHSSPMANKPPHPRSSRSASATSHNPLGLTLELPRASSASTALGQSCPSPRILSPPPIGVSVNVWTNNVATPQPRNPRCASSSLGSPSLDSLFQSSSYSSIPLRSSRATSPSSPSPLFSQTTTQTLRRSFSTTLAEVTPSPTESGVRRSWVDSSHNTLGFTANGQRSFVKQESCPTSPRSGWSSYGNSPPCLSPRAGLQSPISPGRLTPGKGTLGGQHFTSVPWPDVRELSTKYNGTDGLDSGADSTVMDSPSSPSSLPYTLLSSPAPSGGQTEWGDPELEEGSCRSQLICAYVARSPQEQNLSSSSVTSPPFVIYQNHNYQPQVTSQPQVQSSTTAAPVPSTPYPFPLNPSPNKQGNQRTSYATTVNLKIAGSGRITSFSTAQVSLTQTLQGGAGGPGQVTRRVSINGLSQIPSPLPQN